MKKHRTARLLSVILAVVMIFGSISVGVTAAYAPYLDDALTDNYNTIDQVTLTEAQQASLRSTKWIAPWRMQTSSLMFPSSAR